MSQLIHITDKKGARIEDKPLDLDQVRHKLAQTNGKTYWRSLEELSEKPGFTEMLRREFPGQAPKDWAPLPRRDFLKLMGASLALAGLSGCAFQPPEKIVPYVKQPESIVPGIAAYYATAMPFMGYALGLLAESHEGRPTKVEGNPDHPTSGGTSPVDPGEKRPDYQRRGSTDVWAQASILGMYDPERSQVIRKSGASNNWDTFTGEIAQQLTSARQSQGAEFALITETLTSPTQLQLIDDLRQQLPQMRWVSYEPVNRDNVTAGTRLAFGRDLHPVYHFERADVIVSLDCDFLLEEPGRVAHAREFIEGRRVTQSRDKMNRLYVIESTLTNTGTQADHRFPVKAAQVDGIARALAAGVGVAGVSGQITGDQAKWLAPLVEDLKANAGRVLVIAGAHQPPAVHALAMAINANLNAPRAAGQAPAPAPVTYHAPIEGAPVPHDAGLQAVVGEMKAGRIKTALIIGSNPAYAAPADLKFADALKKVPFTAHVGMYDDETGVLCTWHVPESHYLEQWSDARALDGTVSIVQPLIMPLYESCKSPLEVLAALSGNVNASAYDIVRGYWARQRGFGEASPSLAGASATGELAKGSTLTQSGASGLTSQGVNNGTSNINGGGVNAAGGANATGVVGAAGALGNGGGAVENGGGGGRVATGVGGAAVAGRAANGQDPLAFDRFWQDAVHSGVVPGTAAPAVSAGLGALNLPAQTPVGAGIEVNFRPDPTVWDGRFANNGWLQECPKPITKIVWDNAVLVSPNTAHLNGWTRNEQVKLAVNGGEITGSIFLLPGQPDDVITLNLGYGRTQVGKIGTGTGFNANLVRSVNALWFASGAKVAQLGTIYKIAATSQHNLISTIKNPSLGQAVIGNDDVKTKWVDGWLTPDTADLDVDGTHGRDLIRVGTFADLKAGHGPVFAEDKKGVPISWPSDPAPAGEAAHEAEAGESRWPATGDTYKDEHGRPLADDRQQSGNPSFYPRESDYLAATPLRDPKAQQERELESKKLGRTNNSYQWGMSVDLQSCVGCNACVVGCQAENNSAVVGKDQVLMGREMHWIRIDAYMSGSFENPEVYFEPMMCQHCEKAPCAPVCPFNAVMESPEGINEQIYNRCVGTKYCENNCPYKVRRFNFLQYSDQISPQIQLMQNPDVTVRSRGVMEKCTYCIQRVTAAKWQAEKEDRFVKDGDVIVACQQACPTNAIVFGDINDPTSQVSKLKRGDLTFGLLVDFNTGPRTSYSAKIKNPNPALVKLDAERFGVKTRAGEHGETGNAKISEPGAH